MSQQVNEVPNSVMSSVFDFNYEDYNFIQGVIVAAKDVLRIILGFAEIGRLRYLPVRTYVRVISSCIFLLKVSNTSAFTICILRSLTFIGARTWGSYGRAQRISRTHRSERTSPPSSYR